MADRVFQVAILGAGFAGLSTAWHLRKEHSLSDIIVVASRIPKGGTGLCQGGLTDHLNRVAEGVGRDEALALWRYAREGVAEAERLAHAVGSEVSPHGSHLLATFEAEQRDLELSAAMLEEAGMSGRMVRAPVDGREGRPRGLAALFTPEDITIRPPHILPRLQQRLELDGVEFELGAPALRVSADRDSATIAMGDEIIRAEVCVIACGAWAARVHPAFEHRVIPVRAQGFAASLPEGAEGVLKVPISASWGHEVYMTRGNTFLAAGIRPDSTGDDIGFGAEPTETFQAYLHRFAHHRVPSLPEDLPREQPYAGTIALSSDGLPLVGPLPGTERLIAATGFGFRGIACAAKAGQTVADLIAGRKTTPPSCIAARRVMG